MRRASRPRSWRWLAGIGGLALAVLAGVIVGRLTSDASASDSHRLATDPRMPKATEATLGTPHGPSRMIGALPVGFTDDKGGALSCAAVSSETLIDYVQVRRITTPATWIATYATGRLDAPSMQKILDWEPALFRPQRKNKPTQLAPRRHALSISELVPVGYRILSFSPTSAHVQVWLHGAGWSQGSAFPNTVVDRSADVQLVWTSGDWKITTYTQPSDQTWEGPALDDPSGSDFAPWPGGQFTFVTG